MGGCAWYNKEPTFRAVIVKVASTRIGHAFSGSLLCALVGWVKACTGRSEQVFNKYPVDLPAEARKGRSALLELHH